MVDVAELALSIDLRHADAAMDKEYLSLFVHDNTRSRMSQGGQLQEREQNGHGQKGSAVNFHNGSGDRLESECVKDLQNK